MTNRVLILGANGFIGSALVRRLLKKSDCTIVGLDLCCDKLAPVMSASRFRFAEVDITTDRATTEREIRACDVVLPLVAIATPALYVKDPLGVFELDFEENLRVIRLCVEHGKRIIFPSTSEVYGMCQDHEFDEDSSPLVMGPVHKQRWIYGCLKQLLDRVIWAYGKEHGLHFTLFRPFNWIGPRLDSIDDARIGSSRVATQFIGSIIKKRPIVLVDGGAQCRCFTYISDGVDALARIIQEPQAADGQIFNIGNPNNECSIKELALRLHRLYTTQFGGRTLPEQEAFVVRDADSFYGEGYQDLVHRRPSIRKACSLLGWIPRIDLNEALRLTLQSFLAEMPEARFIEGMRA